MSQDRIRENGTKQDTDRTREDRKGQKGTGRNSKGQDGSVKKRTEKDMKGE
jgi:hypothetical protein